MKKDNDILRKEVKDALKWEPLLQTTEIDVQVDDGQVSLGGMVDTYAQKKEAEYVIKKISGVKSVINNVKVDLFISDIKSDAEIKNSVAKALHENWAVPDHKLTISVKDGWVTLKGILHWNFQRKAADDAIRYLNGVRGVIDEIKIQAEIKNEMEKEVVEKALRRSWLLDVDNIKVRVDGKTIFLSGVVDSLFQKEEAERIAWNTPGVWYVDNEILVEFN
ncbi:BON domain-containing protein [Flavobacterium sp. HBTb2-11-1]|uniref:BON domain-containing protein n=1 Tax=Flavobacterium sp. HBTb2-11-1 TaxID=2692212 RepID=UPI00136FC4EB|nr:BON domain-containing protein [Flavobacterium sp. HBTb2-11-1]MXO06721.1 BON domain-containing protein [Flavobacterium sp. HBTb2-11-1]